MRMSGQVALAQLAAAAAGTLSMVLACTIAPRTAVGVSEGLKAGAEVVRMKQVAEPTAVSLASEGLIFLATLNGRTLIQGCQVCFCSVGTEREQAVQCSFAPVALLTVM